MILIKQKHKKKIEYLADLIFSYYIKKLRAPRCSATFLKLLREVYDHGLMVLGSWSLGEWFGGRQSKGESCSFRGP